MPVEFVSAEDKRIRQLQTAEAIQPSWFLPFDGNFLNSAVKATVEDLIAFVSTNVTKQLGYSGAVNPDNAIGEEGDFYFKYNQTTFAGYQFRDEAWEQLFELDFTVVTEEAVDFTDATGVVNIDFGINDRLANFGTNPTVLVYDLDGDVKTFFKDFSPAYNTVTNILSVDGIFGNKTIIIKK